MNPVRRVNSWIQQPHPDFPPDVFGNALYRLNKALLVYVLAPLFVLILLLGWVQ